MTPGPSRVCCVARALALSLLFSFVFAGSSRQQYDQQMNSFVPQRDLRAETMMGFAPQQSGQSLYGGAGSAYSSPGGASAYDEAQMRQQLALNQAQMQSMVQMQAQLQAMQAQQTQLRQQLQGVQAQPPASPVNRGYSLIDRATEMRQKQAVTAAAQTAPPPPDIMVESNAPPLPDNDKINLHPEDKKPKKGPMLDGNQMMFDFIQVQEIARDAAAAKHAQEKQVARDAAAAKP
eukprot:gnl/Spiro4/6743_TR3481_c0_g1_i1.p2 gnl/Spiro4/6743_TR3481_c0_g1~~gnl/Spiro4/6743_TR3481_c0_g1_i1.p2  ORF type:complete len:244 (+),score=88.00 gnl/Spiro4/6743_TR3481_c0_g1_i1:31-732(+)